MYKRIGAALCVLVIAAGAAIAQTPAAAGWSYAYADGVATATQRDERGRVTATLSCQPPAGDLILTDFTLARAARRATSAAVAIGGFSVTVPSAVERRGRARVLVVHLPQRPPILAGVQPRDRVTVTVNNQAHAYLEGSATQMKNVAYACWGG